MVNDTIWKNLGEALSRLYIEPSGLVLYLVGGKDPVVLGNVSELRVRRIIHGQASKSTSHKTL